MSLLSSRSTGGMKDVQRWVSKTDRSKTSNLWRNAPRFSHCAYNVGPMNVTNTIARLLLFLGDRLYKSSAAAEMGDRGHNKHGPKRVGATVAPFAGGRGAGSPSNTMSLELRPTSVPSDILIHPAIWPQQIWAKNWGLRPFWGRAIWGPI